MSKVPLGVVICGGVLLLVIIFMPKGIMDFMTGRRRFTPGDLLQYVRENRVA